MLSYPKQLQRVQPKMPDNWIPTFTHLSTLEPDANPILDPNLYRNSKDTPLKPSLKSNTNDVPKLN